MRDHRYSRLSDAALLHELAARVAQVRVSTATLVALIAEVDARRLYLPAGYSSMHAYCVEKLHLSDDEAYKRIHAARASRQFPLLLAALAEGRLHLTAVCTLAPHLTEENLDELVTAAAHRRRADIEDFLATRFPQAKPPSTEQAAASLQSELGSTPWKADTQRELGPMTVAATASSLQNESLGRATSRFHRLNA
jgi:hypothetical protein